MDKVLHMVLYLRRTIMDLKKKKKKKTVYCNYLFEPWRREDLPDDIAG